jgi:hypothetical protein
MLRRRIAVIAAFGALSCQSARLLSLKAVPLLQCASEPQGPLIACEKIDFGDVSIGTQAGREVTLANEGNTTLIAAGTGWTPGSSSAFTDQFAISSVPVAGQQTFVVSFSPTQLGAASATFFVLTQGGDISRVSLQVTGNGIGEARPVLSSQSVDFGNVLEGTTATQTVSLTNNGNVPMTVTSTSVGTSTVFGVTAPTMPIAAGSSLPVSLTYSPTTVETDSGSALLAVQGEGSTMTLQMLTVTLTGRSQPQILVAPAMVAFTDAPPDMTSTMTVTVTNIGKADLSLMPPALDMSSSPAFSATPAAPGTQTISPTDSTTVTVGFNSAGLNTSISETGTLVLTSNDPTMPTVNVPLSAACPDCNQPDPGCNMAYPHRVWPSAADVGSCTEGNGPLNTTGPGAEDWLDYAGCGNQRDFTTTPGEEISIMTHGDGCACGGCVLWHIDYDLEENTTGTGFQIEDQVVMPDSVQCPATGEVNNTTNYTAVTTDVRMVGEPDTQGEGFYFVVCSK